MSELFVIIISAFVSILVAYITKKSSENKLLVEEINSEKKLLYKRFVDLFTDYILNKEKYTEKKLLDQMGKIRRDTMFYASKDVLNAFSEWTLYSANNSDDNSLAFAKMDRLLFEMRKDI